MKRSRLALLMCPAVLAVIALAVSCSDKGDGSAPLKSGGKYYTAGKDSSTPEASVNIPDVGALALNADAAALLDMQKEIKTVPQAFQAMLTTYDIDESDANLGKADATTPPMQAYVEDLLQGIKNSRARLKALAASKDITPESSNLDDRLKFQSQASQMNLTGIFKNMFNTAFMNRRVQEEKDTLKMVEDQIQPLMKDDDDLKAEYSTIHDEVAKRASRAQTVATGLTDGIGGLDDGMFDDIDPPQGPQAPTPPKPAAKDGGN